MYYKNNAYLKTHTHTLHQQLMCLFYDLRVYFRIVLTLKNGHHHYNNFNRHDIQGNYCSYNYPKLMYGLINVSVSMYKMYIYKINKYITLI